MRQKIFCYIPDVCLNAHQDISSQVRVLLTRALENGLTPAELPKNVRQSVVDLSTEQLEKIMPMAKGLKRAPGRVVGGLLFALHEGTKTQLTNTPNVKGLRPGQVACLEEAAPFLKAGKIVFAEAGTGSGKSRLIAHAAAYALSLRNQEVLPPLRPLGPSQGLPDFLMEHAQKAHDVRDQRLAQLDKPKGAVIVCAPSIENIVHLLKEWQSVSKSLDPKGLIQCSVVLGKAQFVSPTRLALLLGELREPNHALEKWLAAGMKPGQTGATKILAKAAPGIYGLMADLEFLVKDAEFNPQDAALDEDSPPDELTIYKQLRSDAMNADMVITSTAMVAMDNVLLTSSEQAGLLPYPAALFVDEAHTFEGIQASVSAKSLSFFRLQAELRSVDWKSLRKESAAAAVLSAIKKAAVALEGMPDGTLLPVLRSDDRSATTTWSSAQPALDELQDTLAKLTAKQDAPSRSTKTPQQTRALRYTQKALQTLESIKAGWKGHLSQSPKRQQIGFMVGPTSVQKYLLARWETTPMAMLLSGTLTHIGSSGPTIAPIKAEMGVPPDRDAVTTPLHPSWIYSTPTVYTPSAEIFHDFMPPSGNDADEDAMNLWLKRCAKAIAFAASSAEGGMLVLMTSFDRLEGLVKALREKHSSLNDRLISQDRHQRLSQSADVFREMSTAGRKPIWVATGAAWTGLDLSDGSVTDGNAQEDVLLTDLVIPNLPFGLDRNTTHLARISRIGFGAEIVGVQRRLRQGLGRLVRREGLLHRRIWVLDGRLQHPSAQTYTADLQRVLKLYLHHQSFSP